MAENRYYRDDTYDEGYYSKSGLITPTNILIGSAIIAGSIAAYKSGGLKHSMSSAIEFMASKEAQFTTGMNSLRTWTNTDMNAPEHSLFRNGVLGSIKKLAKFDDRVNNSIIDDTVEDLKNLKKRYEHNIHRQQKIDDTYIAKSDYHNTSILGDIKLGNNAVNSYSNKLASNKDALRSKIYEDIINGNMISAEEQAAEIAKKGYRKATLGDMFDFDFDANGKLIDIYEKHNLNFNNHLDDSGTTAKDIILKMVNSKIHSETGAVELDSKFQPMTFGKKFGDKFKNMKIDDHLMINEKGKVADLRERYTSTTTFMRNLATDWQIPIINLNPLRLFGVDKIGLREHKYGTIKSNLFSPYLTGKRGNKNAEHTVGKVLGVDEGVTVINGDVYKMTDNGIERMKFKSKKRLIAIPKNFDKTGALSPITNTLRKQAGIDARSFEEYTKEDGFFKYHYGKITKALDLGRQDIDNSNREIQGMMDVSSYDKFLEMLINKVKVKTYKSSTQHNTLSQMFSSDGNTGGKFSTNYFVINDSVKLKDIIKNKDKETIGNYFKQFTAGFGNYEYINKKTAVPHFAVERMNQALGSFGASLSSESTQSVGGTAFNLIAKRFLPLYLGYQGLQFFTMLTEHGDDGTGNGTKDNIQKMGARTLVKTDVGLHKIMDSMGTSRILGRMGSLMPGGDQLEQLPGFTALNLGQTAKEREEYWKYGKDPVRKSRYWSLGDVGFTGGKIDYFRENLYNRTMADAKFSDSKFGSRGEYFNHTLNPFELMFDKYHYDEKHYEDRPYMLTSPAFENVPLVGSALSSTVGRILKPQVKMHQDYWTGEAQAQERAVKMYNQSQAMIYADNKNQGYIKYNQEKTANSNYEMQLKFYNDSLLLDTLMKADNVQSVEQIENYKNSKFADRRLLNAMYEKSNNPLAYRSGFEVNNEKVEPIRSVYRTASGQLSNVELLNKQQAYQINQGKSTVQSSRLSYDRNDYLTPIPNIDYTPSQDNAVNPNSLVEGMKSQYSNTANVLGIYGFGLESMITSSPNDGKTVIETSGYSRSFNKEFWDQNIGGLGGDLSEIFRRFVQKRSNRVEYYNPIRNTQATWMPGEDGFLNFQNGDPYSKVANGEERIAGEGYERMHRIDNNIDLKIGSSALGKSKEDIVKHLLHKDEEMDDEDERVINWGNTFHERLEKKWLKSGLALDIEREIKDKNNNIIGFYDARVRDESAPEGQAIIDIKTVGQKTIDRVKSTGTADDKHKKQVNYYLWSTGLTRGGIHYVNRDNPDEQFTMYFNFDKQMLKESIDNLNEARGIVNHMIDTKQVSRYDLYEHIDRYRILADVAPYSKEFKEQKKIMSNLQMDEKTKEEYDRINERVTEQREPLRVYPYKFKTSNLDYKKVKVEKVLDNERIMVSGFDKPIRLAGLNLSNEQSTINEAKKILNKNLKPGSNITIGVDHDELARDKGGSIKAVVYNHGKNINRELLKKGLAEENKKDDSPTAIRARYSKGEIAFGSAWESFAHYDTFVHTKMLNVRSYYEDYKRKQVYGKEFKDWTSPYRDFVKPSMYSNMERPEGIVFGAMVGFMIGGKSKYGRLVGSVLGASTVAAAKVYKNAYEIKNNKKWIPKSVRKQREFEEYIDKLKYIKNTKLFNEYAERAKQEDGIDVVDMLNQSKAQGYALKKKKRLAREAKSELQNDGRISLMTRFKLAWNKMSSDVSSEVKSKIKNKYINESNKQVNDENYSDDFSTVVATISSAFRAKKKIDEKIGEKIITGLNKEIEEKSSPKVFKTSENAQKAIEYYNAAKKTMYGYEQGDPITNFMAALPAKDKKYFRGFMEAPEEEREKILDIAPDYMKRALQAIYRKNVDKKEDLEDFFGDHFLPGEQWDGWKENVDLNSIRVKMIRNEGMEEGSNNVWNNDVKKANSYGPIDIPNINYRDRADTVRAKLYDMLNTQGVRNLDISYSYGAGDSHDVDLNIEEDTTEQVKQYMNQIAMEG